MTMSADTRGEIVRLRTEGMTYGDIARHVGVPRREVMAACREHFDDLVGRARAALMREVAAARREMATAPLYRPARGLI